MGWFRPFRLNPTPVWRRRLSTRSRSFTLASGSSLTVKIPLEEVRTITKRALRCSGLREDWASTLTNVIAAAERDQSYSHGLFRIPGYCQAIRESGPFPEPVVTDSGAVVRVDGGGGIAAIAFEAGRELLVTKAKEYGVATAALSRVRHFSALWYETELLSSEHGLVAMAFVNSKAFVAHEGGSKRVYGTNPMSFAFPRPDGEAPLVWDQASSVMARGEIMLANKAGEMLPPGVAIGPDGKETTDPSQALQGSQKTFAAHKGTAIALMVEMLGGILTSSPLGFELEDAPDTHPTENGELIIALDPEKISGRTLKDIDIRVSQLFDMILSEEGPRLPGRRRQRARELTKSHGIEVPEMLYQQVVELGRMN
ncbi:hypothetical protein AAMO2058_000748200 [Amorphochlora amoebiformis]